MKYTVIEESRIVKYQVQKFDGENWQPVNSIRYNSDVEAFGVMDVLEAESEGIYKVVRFIHIEEALIPKII